MVTGGRGEFGRVIIRTWAHGGAGGAMHDFRQQQHTRVQIEKLQALGVRGMTGQADVTHPASADARREAIVHTLGVPHILVNHAVIKDQPWTNVQDQPIADDERQRRAPLLQWEPW
jgi:NAD(P)-dependent dehydrogenase (short-subunit alcohol dehydrogenase family)